MPVSFLTVEQRARYGRYSSTYSATDISRFCHLDDADLALASQKRSDHSRLGFSLQLTTVRFFGTFLEEPIAVPPAVLYSVAKQLGITDFDCLSSYQDNPSLRWAHAAEISARYGYRDFGEPLVGFG